MNDVISCFNSRQWKCDELPDQINIESFLGCNLRCSMCPVPTARKSMNGRKPRAMSMETYRLIIDQVSDKTRTVNLTQLGEPLLNPHIAEFIKYGSDKGHCMGMTTNGTLLTRELGARLMDNGLAWITFSFDGATKETYESIRKGATFEKTLSNIHDFLDMKKSMGSSCQVHVHGILSDVTLPEEHSMTELWAEKDVLFDFIPLDDWGGQLSLPREYGAKRTAQETECQPDNRHPCYLLYTILTVSAEGQVMYCCHDYKLQSRLPSVHQKPLKAIWENDIGLERHKHVAGGVDALPCIACKAWMSLPAYIAVPATCERQGFALRAMKKLRAFLSRQPNPIR